MASRDSFVWDHVHFATVFPAYLFPKTAWATPYVLYTDGLINLMKNQQYYF
jgi:hypothetical protein